MDWLLSFCGFGLAFILWFLIDLFVSLNGKEKPRKYHIDNIN